jgi:serine protease AprX
MKHSNMQAQAPAFRSKALHISVLVAMLALLWASAPAVPGSSQSSAKAQPELLQLAQERPQDSFEVIVQEAGGNGAEAVVRDLGGTILRDLKIINAFTASVQGSDVVDLASSPSVRWVSLDAHVMSANCEECISTSNLRNAYNRAINADDVWNNSPYRQGQGITVAVLDSGMNNLDDLKDRFGTSRIRGSVRFTDDPIGGTNDRYGHGNHVAGIIGGNGEASNGKYVGVAPKANLINVKITESTGVSRMSDVIAGMQWILNNKTTHNIKVVNISLNSSLYESYHVSPLCAAAEILWFNGIVVVASAGNAGTVNRAVLHPPANDPFVITVGAADDRGTSTLSDDVVAPYSSYGVTPEGVSKPDLVAPGTNIVSLMNTDAALRLQYPANIVIGSGGNYFRMSGTSMAAPMVSGAAALLLQDEPNLTPDQVKHRLKSTTYVFNQPGAGAGYLDVHAAVHGTSSTPANLGIEASQLLWTGTEANTWNSVNWNSVNWNSVNWNSVNWNSVNWNSVNWNSTYWGP